MLGRLHRNVRIAAFPDFAEHPLLRLLHALDHLLAGGAARKLVGLRQQRSFARNFANAAGEDLILRQPRHDLLGGQPFRNGHRVLHHLAFDDGGDHVAQAGVLLERVFAGLEIGARLQRDHAADEPPAVDVGDAFAAQNVGDVGDAGALRNVDDLVVPQRTGRLDLLLAVDVESAGADHQHQQPGDDGVADHHPRIAGAIGPLRRRRHLFRLQRGARALRRDRRPFTHRCNFNPVGSWQARNVEHRWASETRHRQSRQRHRRFSETADRTGFSIEYGETVKPYTIRHQLVTRRTITEALVPPNPKEFDSATLISRARGLCGTRSIGGVDRRIVEIDRRRRDVVADRQHAEDGLDRTGGAEQMAGAGFGRGHRHPRGGIAEQPLRRAEFDLVAERRRGAVRVDVVEIRCRDAGALQRRASCSERRRRHPATAR